MSDDDAVSPDQGGFLAAMGATGPGSLGPTAQETRLEDHRNRLLAARVLTERSMVSEGFAVLPCPVCGAGTVVAEGDHAWPCVACELRLAAYRCKSCGSVHALANDPVQEPPGKVRTACSACGSRQGPWSAATVKDILPYIEHWDELRYGQQRTKVMVFPGRRVVKGALLALEGLSGLAVGEGLVVFDPDEVCLLVGRDAVEHRLDYRDLERIKVAGRGEVVSQSGGGWMGGGFGLSGAIQGALTASVLNALTSVTTRTVETVIEIVWNGGRVTLLNGAFPPDKWATLLKPVVARVNPGRQSDPSASATPVTSAPRAHDAAGTLADRLQQLLTLMDAGLISEEEYQAQRQRILLEI